MTPSSSERTVKIPVQWIDGQWQLVGGGKLPALVSNACADLVIPAISLADDYQRARWSEEITFPMLGKGTELFVRVKLDNVPESMRNKLEKMPHEFRRSGGYVKIVLDGDLYLAATLGKKAKLRDCKCNIPALNDTAKSMNEAYKKIVTVFEPNRRSNAGNVFSLAWLEQDGRFIMLDDVREQTTNDVASEAARPRERSETWDELATRLSQVYEVWVETSNDSETALPRDASGNSEARFVFPQTNGDALKEPGEAFFNFRLQLMSRYREGLEGILSRFNDPKNSSLDIVELRKLKVAMDQAVLEAYGWHDLAQTAISDFLPDYEEVGDQGGGVGDQGNEGSTRSRRRKTWRFRWPDDFRDEVLARLLEFNEQGHCEEQLSGAKPNSTADGKERKSRKSEFLAKSVKASDQASQQELF